MHMYTTEAGVAIHVDPQEKADVGNNSSAGRSSLGITLVFLESGVRYTLGHTPRNPRPHLLTIRDARSFISSIWLGLILSHFVFFVSIPILLFTQSSSHSQWHPARNKSPAT